MVVLSAANELYIKEMPNDIVTNMHGENVDHETCVGFLLETPPDHLCL
jgi:hypothetical protein